MAKKNNKTPLSPGGGNLSDPLRRITRFTRRQFIKTTGVGVAGLSAASLGLARFARAGGEKHYGADARGSLIGAVRLIPENSYWGVPELLAQYIKAGDETAWSEIKEKINYTYRKLHHALDPILDQRLRRKVRVEIKAGKKLFFKPNIVNPEVLSLAGDGSPGSTTGIAACTDWVLIAALMRFFHDKLAIPYYRMAIGEAGTFMPTYSTLIGCTPEALLEGTPFSAAAGYWAGWPFYFARKYLQECDHDSDEDPMSGYLDSITGNYVTPGMATSQGKLMVYDLNQAEGFDRGRLVHVPDGGDNYHDGIVIHKALIGDPDDLDNYPGNVLVNAPILKVHALTTITNAMKNLGVGGWPMCAGHDNDSNTHDWMYAYPPDHPPGFKAGLPGLKEDNVWKGHGVYHDKWYVVDANDEGMPRQVTDTPNFGLDGTIVDMNLALRSQVPCILHVVDAIKVIDIEHSGLGSGIPRKEGLVFASEDPVALDLLCARYMFKNLPKESAQNHFLRLVPVPRYENNSILSIPPDPDTGPLNDFAPDSRVSYPRATLFQYASHRGLGRTSYYIEGKDKATRPASPLVSKDGHFGRIERGKFVEIMTDALYFHQMNCLWDLQPTVLAYARATDQLSGSNYHGEFMSLDEDGNGIIDDREFGKNGMWDCLLGVMGIGCSLLGKGRVNQGRFFMYSRLLKCAYPGWNVESVDSARVYMDSMAVAVSLRLARGTESVDPFFGIPTGTGADGNLRWPSLQFARYGLEMTLIYDRLYTSAVAQSAATQKDFTFYVPESVPYFPVPAVGYNPYGLGNVVETTDPAKIFSVEFTDGEVW